ncbi:hypothetical protein AAVH_18250 [Aphelenchoides avenae]|nr:hypothetical protein AAVH_26201 [Aphelenchus avenae]KAH7714366.1 hypothetical protein AAVH_18250 [Aphelenchus avenae]
MAFNKVLVCVVLLVALVAFFSVCEAQDGVAAKVPCVPSDLGKYKTNFGCPANYQYNVVKRQCCNAFLLGGGK